MPNNNNDRTSHAQPNQDANAVSETGRTYGGQTLEERSQQRRAQLLDAALEVFGSTGFRHATVRGICRQAQLTDRYFYSEFGSLEALLQSVYAREMDAILHSIIALISAKKNSSIEDIARQTLEIYFSAMQNPKVARLCMLELEGVSPESDIFYHGYMQKFSDLIIAMLKSMSPQWPLSDEESAYLGTAFVGAMRQVTTYWIQNGCKTQQETLVNTGMTILISIINHKD